MQREWQDFRAIFSGHTIAHLQSYQATSRDDLCRWKGNGFINHQVVYIHTYIHAVSVGFGSERRVVFKFVFVIWYKKMIVEC